MKDSKKLVKSLGFIGVALCAACCLLPGAGVLAGIGALTLLAGFLEWAGIIAIVAAIVFVGIHYFKNRKTRLNQMRDKIIDDSKS
jgi:hypothetical protein